MSSDAERGSRGLAARRDLYATVATSLALMSDRQIGELVEGAQSLGSGIGGAHALAHVGDTPVFVKRVPLTDVERRAENVMSTANLFDLPMGCHYGVGSPSFGVWRELAANAMTTGWVLAGRAQGYPLMYHWRVIDGAALSAPLSEELADEDRAVGYWHGSAAVRRRIEAFNRASATVTLFLEYLPVVLPDWLQAQVSAGEDALDAAITMVEQSLRNDVAAMNAAGLFHFDAHLGNILTDGHRLYFADFGLATSPRFDLSAAETDFLAANLSHDPCHTITRFVDWLVTNLTEVPDWQARDAWLRRVAGGESPAGLPASAATVVQRYAPIAAVINEFYRQLHLHDRATPYPAAEVERACRASGFAMPWRSKH